MIWWFCNYMKILNQQQWIHNYLPLCLVVHGWLLLCCSRLITAIHCECWVMAGHAKHWAVRCLVFDNHGQVEQGIAQRKAYGRWQAGKHGVPFSDLPGLGLPSLASPRKLQEVLSLLGVFHIKRNVFWCILASTFLAGKQTISCWIYISEWNIILCFSTEKKQQCSQSSISSLLSCLCLSFQSS